MASSAGPSNPTDTPKPSSNCFELDHLWDVETQSDYHWDSKEDEWVPCDQTLCLYRYSGQYSEGSEWGIPVEHWQTDTAALEQFNKDLTAAGLEPEPAYFAQLPPETPLPSLVPTVVHTPVENPEVEQTLPHNLTHLFEEEEVAQLLEAPSQVQSPVFIPTAPLE